MFHGKVQEGRKEAHSELRFLTKRDLDGMMKAVEEACFGPDVPEGARRRLGSTDDREEKKSMSRYSDFDDLDLDDEDLPLVEIEFDDEEDGKSRKAGTILKVLLIILIVGALLAAGFFVVRYVLGQQSPKIETTSTVTPEPTMGAPSGPAAGTNGSAGADTSNADQTQSGDTAMGGDMGDAVITTPAPAPTPTPAPTAKPIPEQYVIPGVDPGDLDAVRAYIQDQLNAMAADVNYPNVDEYTVNEDCTVFTAVCTSLNESAAERGATEKIYEFGRMYAAYAGTTVDNIHIDYRNHMGDLLWTRDSNK